MKYKVGDRVKIKSLDWYNENKGNADKTNSVWCEDGGAWFFYHMTQYCGKIMTIESVWALSYTLEGSDSRWTDGMIEGLVEDKAKQNNDMEEMLLGWVKESDNLRLVPHKDYEIKHDGDNFYLVKKKKEYPKTYEECAKIMNCPIAGPSGWLFKFDANIKDPYYRKIDILMGKFTRLLICRDAYWKIAGEEMGLGKLWEPDSDTEVYNIYHFKNIISISGSYCVGNSNVLEFPTEEMRDAFYENFKEEIEQCKELL